MPPPRDPTAVEEIIGESRTAATRLGLTGLWGAPFELAESTVATLAGLAPVALPALETLAGAILAQELVKVTGKFTPISQWFAFSDVSILPPWAVVPVPGRTSALEGVPLPSILRPAADEFDARGERLQGLITIFGRRFQAQVANARVFLIGAGALGCEYMKQFALAGLGCGDGETSRGLISVTDMDRIEASNLSRQFLFRGTDVDKFKSACVCAAACAANPRLIARAYEAAVGPDTELAPFDDAFWRDQDVMVTALDNLTARQYVDARSRWFSLPYVQGGTLGLKGSASSVAPFETSNYNETTEETDSIAMCTVRSFPSLPLHCIEWARNEFAGLFSGPFTAAAAIIAAPEDYCKRVAKEARHNPTKQLAVIRPALAALELMQTATLEMLVEAARVQWQASFHDKPAQLAFSMPRDYVDPESGLPFWCPPKRFPTPLDFNASDPLHLAYIRTYVQITAAATGVALPGRWAESETLAPLASSIVVKPFVPSAGAKIATKEEDAGVDFEDGAADAVKAILTRIRELHASPPSAAGIARGLKSLLDELGGRLSPTAFEKDDNSNGHVDFLTSATNLRSLVYAIQPTSRFTVRLTAGRIIPAVATCTAAVTGLGMLELYKLLQGKSLASLREHTFNMAINAYEGLGVEPDPPRRDAVRNTEERKGTTLTRLRHDVIPARHSLWDRLVLRGGFLRWVYGPESCCAPRIVPLPADPTVRDLNEALSVLNDMGNASRGDSSGGNKVVLTALTTTVSGGKKPRPEILYDALGGDADTVPLSALYATAVRGPPSADPVCAARGYWLLTADSRLEPEAALPAGFSRGTAVVPPIAVCFAL